jgi:hypothetical protein
VAGDPQSWNRYAYVENDPINLSDPSGQGFWEDLGFAIAEIFVAYFAPPALIALGVPTWEVQPIVKAIEGGISLAGGINAYQQLQLPTGQGTCAICTAGNGSPPVFSQQGPPEEDGEIPPSMRNPETDEIDPDAEAERALRPLKPGETIPEPNRRIPGAIYPERGENGPLGPKRANDFDWYIPVKLESPARYFRQWGGRAGREGKGDGTYYSFFPPVGSRNFMRRQMSLPEQWNSMEHTDAVTIPAGQTVYIGPAAPQAGYPGGGIQVFVPKVF